MKPLDSCNLCLSKVSSPIACGQGHIYCRECALSNLITQKAGIEQQKREMERWEANEAREREDARMAARQRVISDFEKNMGLGLGGSGGRAAVEARISAKEVDKEKFGRGTVERIALEAEEKALRTIELEQAESRKAKLAAFWLPSLAPEAKLPPLQEIKLQTLCQIGESPHEFS